MVTPFQGDGSLNLTMAAELAEYLAASGSDALVVCGTTGEAPVLTVREKLQLLERVLETVGDRLPVLMGTGTYDTRTTIELSRRAHEAGAHGLLVVTPYYNRPPQAGLLEHFRQLAESVDLPIMLYNVPSRTGCNLLPETVNQLLQCSEHVRAVKEASGSVQQMGELIRLTGGRVLVYSGDDSLTLPALAVGAQGVVSVASHLVGPRLARMMALFGQGRVDEARDIHLELLPLFKALFVATNPIPLKAALRLLGWPVGECRPPLYPAPAGVVEQVRRAMEQTGILA